jgi:hypothetical protein
MRRTGRKNALTDVESILVGHHSSLKANLLEPRNLAEKAQAQELARMAHNA